MNLREIITLVRKIVPLENILDLIKIISLNVLNVIKNAHLVVVILLVLPALKITFSSGEDVIQNALSTQHKFPIQHYVKAAVIINIMINRKKTVSLAIILVNHVKEKEIINV